MQKNEKRRSKQELNKGYSKRYLNFFIPIRSRNLITLSLTCETLIDIVEN